MPPSTLFTVPPTVFQAGPGSESWGPTLGASPCSGTWRAASAAVFAEDGQLNEREANRLNRQQEQVNKMEDGAKSDGVITKKERARISAAQNRASRHIAREKHDCQGKRPINSKLCGGLNWAFGVAS